jgi:nucleoporin SEH1
VDEIDVQTVVAGPSPGYLSRTHTIALATPTQTHATLEGASASLVAQALQQGLQQGTGSSAPLARPGIGNREADGGWCLSWCKDRYWGEVIAAGCGTSGTIKVHPPQPSLLFLWLIFFSQIIQINARRSNTLLTLDATPSSSASNAGAPVNPLQTSTAVEPANTPSGTSYAITSVAWAPSCGRSYHLIATGGRDGHVRIWKVKPGSDDAAEGDHEAAKWTAVSVADFDHHK